MGDVDPASDPASDPGSDAHEGGPVVRPEDMRAGDADREQVVERLRQAHAEGRLDLDEFDERVTTALAARTYGELARVTDDLPGEPPSPRAVAQPAGRSAELAASGEDPGVRSGVVSWAAVSTTTLTIWAVSCVATMSFVYPWWIWVAGPWGLVLLSTWIGTHRGPGR